MKIHNQYLDKLANGQSTVLVFDCEFWHVLKQDDDSGYQYEQPHFFFMPREIGGFFFTKVDDGWEYKKHFFVTLDKPDREVAFPISHYSTVTGPTGYKLDELEGKLGTAWGNAFPSRLSEEGQEIHKLGIQFYQRDPNIKKHHKSSSWLSEFISRFPECTLIVKGLNDLIALQNACVYYGFDYQEPAQVVDIAEWNSRSRKLCGTAKLEGTFGCVRKKIPDNIGNGKTFRDILPLGKSHDPSVDASMTFLVALYIESQRP